MRIGIFLPRRANLFAARLDVDFLGLERLAAQPVGEPVDDQRARARVADRMLLALVDDQHLRAAHLFHEVVDELDRAKLVVLARDDEIRAANLRRHALERQRLGELVERRLVVVAGHIHVVHLEGRRSGVEDRVLPGLDADAAHGAGFEARLGGGDARPPVRAHARAHDREMIGVDLRPLGKIIGRELARVLVVRGRALDAAGTRLALAGAVDREHRDAALDERLAVERVVFLHAVHAGNVEHARHFLAGLQARRQVQQRGDVLSFIRKLDALDRPAGEADEFVVTLALLLAPGDALRIVVFVDSPHQIRVKSRRDVIVLARLDLVAGAFGLARQFLAARRRARELARDIGEFLHAPADLAQVRFDPGAAVAQNLAGAPLVPIEPACLDDLVEQPALLAPALHLTFGFDSHDGSFLLRSDEPVVYEFSQIHILQHRRRIDEALAHGLETLYRRIRRARERGRVLAVARLQKRFVFDADVFSQDPERGLGVFFVNLRAFGERRHERRRRLRARREVVALDGDAGESKFLPEIGNKHEPPVAGLQRGGGERRQEDGRLHGARAQAGENLRDAAHADEQDVFGR